jgi:small subunit ribosomal protein S16
MALKIRLARSGSKNRPYYNIVVAEGKGPREGKFIEELGSYNPLLNEEEKRISIFLYVCSTKLVKHFRKYFP